MKSRATQRTQVYLPPELHQRARVLGLRARRSLTSLVRVALERYVEEACERAIRACTRSHRFPDRVRERRWACWRDARRRDLRRAMSTVLVDTAAWVALFDERDRDHRRAKSTLPRGDAGI